MVYTSDMEKEIQWLLDEKYGGKETPEFKKDLARLESGEPLDYIIGFTEFLGCNIDLSKKPLIPRFETEFWVKEVMGELKSFKVHKVLDLFSGSGAIGIAIAKQVPNVHIAFADSEQNCIEQIEINCTVNNITKSRYEIIQSDIFTNINGRFDVIVANPPYIPTAQASNVQTSVINYEPREALFGGIHGLDFIEPFLRDAKEHVGPGASIYMEFDSPQKSAIAKLITQLGYRAHEFRKDQYDRWRFVKISI